MTLTARSSESWPRRTTPAGDRRSPAGLSKTGQTLRFRPSHLVQVPELRRRGRAGRVARDGQAELDRGRQGQDGRADGRPIHAVAAGVAGEDVAGPAEADPHVL